MPRSNPNNPTSNGASRGGSSNNSLLTEDQQAAIQAIKEERYTYQKQLQDARKKRNKIKKIIDNFESIVVGDIILDILPDENSEEILNSLIISKGEISRRLSGVDVSPILEEITTTTYVPYNGTYGTGQYVTTTELVETGETVSGYVSEDISDATGILNSIFKQSLVQELIEQSTVLKPEELYVPIYFDQIEQSLGKSTGKDVLRDVISEIESEAI